LLAVVALLIALTIGPGSAHAAPFGVSKLRMGSSSAAENYIYTDGNVVFGQATVEPGTYYRFSVLDPGGGVQASSSCIQAFFRKGASYSYPIKPTDPVTTTTAWRLRLEEWSNATCSGGAAKTHSLYFDLARASSFADSGLGTPRSTFAAGTSAYVKVAGAGRVKTTPTNTAQNDWRTTWILPSAAIACANTGGGDRPDADAGGLLPNGSPLKYRPNPSGPSAAWNLESNYDGACPDFGPANDGAWKLRLQKDGTHFVTLPAFKVDATPPDTALTSGPAGPTSFTNADFTFTASEAASSFECRLDGGAWQSCSSPKHYAGLSEASHDFQVRALDAAGNSDPTPASFTWTIDTTLPAVTVTAPPDGSATSDATPTFSGTAGTEVDDFATVTVKVVRPVQGGPDELVQTLTTTRVGGTWSVTPTVALPEGPYKVHAEQSDGAANVGFSAEHAFRVDGTAPAVALVEPHAGSVTSDATPELGGTAGNATGDAGDVTVKVYSGSSASGSPTRTATAQIEEDGSWAAEATPALPDGPYTARAEQVDDAGNLGLSRARSFRIDTAPPDTSITAGPADATASTSASFHFASTESDAQLECRLDDQDWGSCSSPKAYSGLADGAHTFEARSIDAAGNEDPTPASRTWTVDTTLPEVTLVNPADGAATRDTTPTFDGSAGTRAGDSSTVTVRVYRPVAGAPDELVETRAAARAGDGSWSVDASPALPEGGYVARAEQRDGVGNLGTSVPHSFRVDTSAPNTYFTLAPVGTTGSTAASFGFDATEEGSSFECRLDGGAWGGCSSPATRSGLSDGPHTFQVRATDSAGNTDGSPASVTWTVDTTLSPLTLEQPADGARTSDGTPAFSGHAGTGPGDAATVTVKIYRPGTGGPATLVRTLSATRSVLDGAWSVSASPELDEGDYYAYAQQVQAGGTAVSAVHSFTVDTSPPHTLITSGPQGTTSAATASFRFGSSEPSSTFECRLDGAAWQSCTSPAPYAGLSNDVHTFEVRAIDPAGNTDPTPASRTWVVDSSAPAVTLETPPDDALTNDSTPLFSGHASTQAGDASTVTVEVYRPVANGPDTLVETLATTRAAGDGSWSVSASPALADGTYLAYASQDDNAANTAYSPPRTFTVDASAPLVTLTAPPLGVPANDPTPTLKGSAGAEAGDSTTVTVKLYAGSTISGSPLQTLSPTRIGGSWSVEPSALADGTYTARAEQADAAGNTGTSAPRTFRVDTTAPSTQLVSGPSGTTSSTTAAFAFTSSEAGSKFQCRRDGASFAPCSSPRAYTGLALDSHSFAVRAIDAAGNTDASPATRAWTVVSAPAVGSPGGTSPAATPPAPSLAFSLHARRRQRFRKRSRRVTVVARCSAACELTLSGKIKLSRARRRAGLTRRQAAAKRLKLRRKSYSLAAGKDTRLRLRLSRRIARRVLSGLRQHRRVGLRLRGVAARAGAQALAVTVKARLRR